MAMVANAMASSIISEVQGCTDPVDANNKFYKALCDYVEANAQVFYSWVAFSPPPASLSAKSKAAMRTNTQGEPKLALSFLPLVLLNNSIHSDTYASYSNYEYNKHK